jgi:hypothetical protein
MPSSLLRRWGVQGMRELLAEGWTANLPRYDLDVQAQFRTVPKREPLCCKDEDAKPLSLPTIPFPEATRAVAVFYTECRAALAQICAAWRAE